MVYKAMLPHAIKHLENAQLNDLWQQTFLNFVILYTLE